jgi:hypothetical protein
MKLLFPLLQDANVDGIGGDSEENGRVSLFVSSRLIS